jgi:hypothetical protein
MDRSANSLPRSAQLGGWLWLCLSDGDLLCGQVKNNKCVAEKVGAKNVLAIMVG